MRSLIEELELDQEIDEADDDMTPAYDDDPALVGKQKTKLPDVLQKAIIKKKSDKTSQQENRTMRITKRQLRRIIREERRRMLNEGMRDVLRGAEAFGRSLGGRPDLAMKIGAALTASDVPQEIVTAITDAYERSQAAMDQYEYLMDPPSR
jgi:uncharacterized protein YdcH (DUF465 family)